MAIIHIAFPEGVPMLEIGQARDMEGLQQRLGQIVADEAIPKIATLLEPNTTTRVTPPHWKRHTHEYFAEAFPNGGGVVHIMPRDDGVAFMTSEDPNVLQKGGLRTLFPQEAESLPILGPNRKSTHLLLWSLVSYLPNATERPRHPGGVPPTFRN